MVSTTVLTFWLCLAGTTCDAEHAIPGSMASHQLNISVIQCDLFDAVTNQPYFESLIAVKHAARHSCDPAGTDL